MSEHHEIIVPSGLLPDADLTAKLAAAEAERDEWRAKALAKHGTHTPPLAAENRQLKRERDEARKALHQMKLDALTSPTLAELERYREALEQIGPHKGKRSCHGLPTCPWCLARRALQEQSGG